MQFDGGPSVSPPAGGGLQYLVVRYDPANVGVVLPEAVVAHPSYARLMALTAEGAGIAATALALRLVVVAGRAGGRGTPP